MFFPLLQDVNIYSQVCFCLHFVAFVWKLYSFNFICSFSFFSFHFCHLLHFYSFSFPVHIVPLKLYGLKLLQNLPYPCRLLILKKSKGSIFWSKNYTPSHKKKIFSTTHKTFTSHAAFYVPLLTSFLHFFRFSTHSSTFTLRAAFYLY